MNHLEFGQEMESRACAWMQQEFPALLNLHRNYRWKGGELDLVFEDPIGRELIFVEVRARKAGALVDALSSITFRKQVRLARTIEHFLSRYRGRARSVRLDVLAWDGVRWNHLKNVGLSVSSKR